MVVYGGLCGGCSPTGQSEPRMLTDLMPEVYGIYLDLPYGVQRTLTKARFEGYIMELLRILFLTNYTVQIVLYYLTSENSIKQFREFRSVLFIRIMISYFEGGRMAIVSVQWIGLLNTSHSLMLNKDGCLFLIRVALLGYSFYILAMNFDLSQIITSIRNRYI
ncbi:hypothetical protein BDV40DRAFT_136620 [Aspergillus tamarii]|uniref:Uncharacterized protein n=1 Tax=Aspergillus tamarii TaxID=41984 RepID=A0A5N6UY83_ASPTM|nr:hypothetical protein BDV40DRAFT_136620 [Aspergillus tamarii]